MKPSILLLLISMTATGLNGQNFRTVNDLEYYETGGTDEKQKLDLYLPDDVSDGPMLIWIHGGAWAFGNRKQERELAAQFASKGIAVAAISYRLSPGTWADPKFDKGIQHPEHINDVAHAFAWIYQHAQEYGYSANKVFVSGYSAGGHLAALLVTDTHYLTDLGLSAGNVRGVIPIAGAYDISSYHDTHYRYNGPEMAEKHVKAVFGNTEADLANASPTNFIDNLSVPMLLISENQSYNYTQIFEKALKKAQKKDVSYLHVRELNHKAFYEDLAKSQKSKYRDQIIEFIRQWSSKLP